MAVARRRVLYIPGYDPIPPRRYRELYRREGAEQARIAGYALTMGARKDRAGFGWGVVAEFPPELFEAPADAAGSPHAVAPGTAADGRPHAGAGAAQSPGPDREPGPEIAALGTQGTEASTRSVACGKGAGIGQPHGEDGGSGPLSRAETAAPGRATAPPAVSVAQPAMARPDPVPPLGGRGAQNTSSTFHPAPPPGGPAAEAASSPFHPASPSGRQAADPASSPSGQPPPAPPPRGRHPLQVEAEIEVLVWSDVVAASMGRSIAATYGQLLRTAWIYIASGALAAMMRLRRGPVLAALYPVAVLLGQALLALVLAGALGWLAARLLPGWMALALALAGFVALLIGWKRLDGRLFAHYLMHDYAFTARLRGAYPPELEARISRFADRLAEVLEGDWDEVLVVGHSSGAYLAVSVLAELARRQPPDPRLALLTLGHVVPMAAFLPRAQQLRGDLAAVSASGVPWVDVSAPGDACSFGLCDPVATCGIEPARRHGPLVLSAAFSDTLSPQRLRALRHRWFRLHFQYLCAFDHPQRYDYFAITAGPLTLADRFAGRPHSPGRITRAVSPFRDQAP